MWVPCAVAEKKQIIANLHIHANLCIANSKIAKPMRRDVFFKLYHLSLLPIGASR